MADGSIATKERPILFSAPMVRAILEGRKTQTRRIITPQPKVPVDTPSEDMTRAWNLGLVDVRCPYGEPGDRMWVRETWGRIVNAGHRYVYRADGEPRDRFSGEPIAGMKWAPSIHMPRAVSRIDLRVTSVRVERLQAITEEDAIAEGVEPASTTEAWSCFCEATHDTWDMFVEPSEEYRRERGVTHVKHHPAEQMHSAREAFRRLWDDINGERASWESNPWVWVVGFEVIR